VCPYVIVVRTYDPVATRTMWRCVLLELLVFVSPSVFGVDQFHQSGLDPNKADDVMLAIVIAAAGSKLQNSSFLAQRMSVSVFENIAKFTSPIIHGLKEVSYVRAIRYSPASLSSSSGFISRWTGYRRLGSPYPD